jgi:integration host factor subunit alpha
MKETTNKNDLVESLFRELDFPKKETQNIVDSLFEIIRIELEQGNAVKLPRFGNFTIHSKRSRVGRNPKTGESMEITARKVISFKPSTLLRDRVTKGS